MTLELVPANVDTTVKSGNRFSIKYAGEVLTATAATYSTDIAATAPAAYNFAPPMAVDSGTLTSSQTGTTFNVGLMYGF